MLSKGLLKFLCCFSCSSITCLLFLARPSIASDKLDIYMKSAESKINDPNLGSRYLVGALQEARKLSLVVPVQAEKYAQLEKLTESIYKKVKEQKNYNLALTIASEALGTERKLSGEYSPKLLKYLFFAENTLCLRDTSGKSPQLYKDTLPYYLSALSIGERMKPVAKKDAYGPAHQQAFLLTAIIKDYMSTLKALHRDSELAALQARINRMPVFSDGESKP